MRHPRGMALLETVLALSLLAVLASVSVSWAMGFARLAGETGEHARWNSAALEIRRSLEDDLQTRDFELVSDATRAGKKEQVTVTGSALTIRTRVLGLGPVEARYGFDNRTHTVSRTIAEASEVLLGEVDDAQFSIEDGVLRIELAGPPGMRTLHIELPDADPATDPASVPSDTSNPQTRPRDPG